MLLVVSAALVLLVAVTAALALWAGRVAERAVRLAQLERRRDHWRRVAEAAQEVEEAAIAYQRAMEARSGRRAAGGDTGRRDDARECATRYREGCRRLARVLAGGPRPPGSHGALTLLLDAQHPETVAAARPAEAVLGEVMELQDGLDAPDRVAGGGALAWRLRARVRLGLIGVRGQVRGIRE